MNRRLTRCRHDRRIAGVAAGVAEFFELDPTLVRILWLASIFVGGLGILLYIGLAIIVPLEPLADDAAVHGAGTVEPHHHASRGDGRLTTLIGAGIMLIGGIALLDQLLPAWVDAGRFLWPAFLIGFGALLVFGAFRREPGSGSTDRPTEATIEG